MKLTRVEDCLYRHMLLLALSRHSVSKGLCTHDRNIPKGILLPWDGLMSNYNCHARYVQPLYFTISDKIGQEAITARKRPSKKNAGRLQLSATPATSYYLNPDVAEAHHIRQLHKFMNKVKIPFH